PGENAGQISGSLAEDLALVEASVPVGVLEDENSVPRGLIPRPAGALERVALCDPQSPAVVDGDRDRLSDVGFRREESGLEAGRNREAPERLLRRQRDVLGVFGIPDPLRVPVPLLLRDSERGSR